MRQLQTSTLSNQNISAYLLVATYTADADRALLITCVLDQVAGGGDYSIYITRRIAGAGSAYMVGPITTFAVPAAQTAIAFSSLLLPIENTDVVKVYVKGLAGDIATPDIITRFYELAYLRPAVAGRTLDVGASGEVQASGVGTPVALDGGAATLAGMLTKLADDAGGAAFDATTDSLEKISAAVATLNPVAAGSIEYTYTVTNSVTGLPISSVDVWISTDSAVPPVNVVWRGTTDAFGVLRDASNNKPWLDPGTYYFWRQHENYLATNPDTEVVS